MARFAPYLPYEEFPLFPLLDGKGGGRLAKKIMGKLKYFGTLAEGWEAALAEHERTIDALKAGKRPRETSDELTVKALCDHYYHAKKPRHEPASWPRRRWPITLRLVPRSSRRSGAGGAWRTWTRRTSPASAPRSPSGSAQMLFGSGAKSRWR